MKTIIKYKANGRGEPFDSKEEAIEWEEQYEVFKETVKWEGYIELRDTKMLWPRDLMDWMSKNNFKLVKKGQNDSEST